MYLAKSEKIQSLLFGIYSISIHIVLFLAALLFLDFLETTMGTNGKNSAACLSQLLKTATQSTKQGGAAAAVTLPFQVDGVKPVSTETRES